MCGWRQLLGLTATGAVGVCGWRQLLGLTATGAVGVCGWRQLLGLTAHGQCEVKAGAASRLCDDAGPQCPGELIIKTSCLMTSCFFCC